MTDNRLTTISVDFHVEADPARAADVVDDMLYGIESRIESHAEADAASDNPTPPITWRRNDPVVVDEVGIALQRSRLARISRVVDMDALTQAMREALNADDDSQLSFANLSHADVVALLERFDRTGYVVQRTAATKYQPERASIGAIMPSGEVVSIRADGPDTSLGQRTPSVSWPSIGDVDPADAAAFASAMGVAAGVASMLSSQIADDK